MGVSRPLVLLALAFAQNEALVATPTAPFYQLHRPAATTYRPSAPQMGVMDWLGRFFYAEPAKKCGATPLACSCPP